MLPVADFIDYFVELFISNAKICKGKLKSKVWAQIGPVIIIYGLRVLTVVKLIFK